MNISGESLQPSVEELEAQIISRETLLCHGPTVVEFNLTHLSRDEDTRRLKLNPENPVTSEVAQQYLGAFLALTNKPELRFAVLDATSLNWTEICHVKSYLDAIAKQVEA